MGEVGFKTIKEFAKIRRGASPRPIENPKFFGGTVGWVRISDVSASKKYLKRTEDYLSELGEQFSVRVDKGDLVYSIAGSIGKPIIIDMPACIHDGFVQIYDLKNADPEFLYYFLQSIEATLYKFGQAGTQINLNSTIVGDLKVPYYPLSEQTRIAQILSKADDAIAHTEALIAKYQRIKTGLLQDLLTRGIDENGDIRSEETHEFKDSPLGRIPVEWEVAELGRIYQIKSGSTPHRKNKKFFENGKYNWVKTLDLNEGTIYETEEKITDLALENTSCKIMPSDSILIAMYGGWEQIGRTAILGKPSATNQAISILQNPNKPINSYFIQFFLQYFRFRWKLFAVSTRKDPNITKSDIENFQVSFPSSKKEQDCIVERIQGANFEIKVLTQNLAKLHALKRGLMQDLLGGPRESA